MEAYDQQQQQEAKERRRGGRRGTGVKLSTDPQSVAARERRHRISERFRVLKSLVPGGSKMDTVSMLEEAIHYVKFLKTQIWLHQADVGVPPDDSLTPSFPSCTYDDDMGGGDQIGDHTTTHYNAAASLLLTPSHPLYGYSMHASLPPLPPFPFSSFQGEEDMNPHGFNY